MRSILSVINVLGALIALFTAYYALPLVTAAIYGETGELRAFAICAGITLVIGLALLLLTHRFRSELKPRDGYLLVSLSWLAVAAAGALPLMLGEPQLSFTDAYFESISGLSTTGSTVITGLDKLPYSVNLWRHALHWLGGMGIIVLAVAILPLLGVGGMQMYRAETPGPVKDAKLTAAHHRNRQGALDRLRRHHGGLRAGALGDRHVALRRDLPCVLGDGAGRLLDARQQHRLVRLTGN